MSKDTARETLQAIDPQELLKVHNKLELFTDDAHVSHALVRLSKPLFMVGLDMFRDAGQLNWYKPLSAGLRSGADRTFLATLKLLSPKKPTSDQDIASTVLRRVPKNFHKNIRPEHMDLIWGNGNQEAIIEVAEREILLSGYLALGALSNEIESHLITENLTTGESPIKEATMARAGSALASLAISRYLMAEAEDPLEKLFKLEFEATDSTE